MFWGLIIEPGKKYSQTVESSFHISKATLDLSNASDDEITLMLDYEGQQEYILCHLNKGNKQESLDLNFQAGDSISLFSQGQSSIHLSGYLLGDEDDDEEMTLGDFDEEDEEEEEDEEMDEEDKADLREALLAKAMKRGIPANGKNKAQKKGKFEVEDESEDDEEEEEEDEAKSPPAKQQQQPQQKSKSQLKKEKKLQAQKAGQPGQVKQETAPQAKKNAGSPAADAKPAAPQPTSPVKKTLSGGLVVEELKVGTGREAKNGDQIAVYYSGKLQKNGKQFDQTNKGPGFKFKLGAGRVIKGWDLGLVGMKVGGKRKLTIPAALAYGAGGSPPQIPPNSTLVFDVELKALN